MTELQPLARALHLIAIAASGSLFLARGLLVLGGHQARALAAPLRYLSYGIDTVLLGAAIVLAMSVRQYPFVHAWLTTKVLLLGLYIVLGSLALKRGRTHRVRGVAFVGALAVFVFIVGVARRRHPWGWLAPWLG
jgi:uncharacterized membrane protein SirB2